jgi:hypothetical protein
MMNISHKDLSEKGLSAMTVLRTHYPSGAPAYPDVPEISGLSADEALKEFLIKRQKTSAYPPESENRRRWAKALEILSA